jgi:hypothetical protein
MIAADAADAGPYIYYFFLMFLLDLCITNVHKLYQVIILKNCKSVTNLVISSHITVFFNYRPTDTIYIYNRALQLAILDSYTLP